MVTKKIILSMLSTASLAYAMDQQPNITIKVNGVKIHSDYLDKKTYKGIIRAIEFQKHFEPTTFENNNKNQEKK